MRILGADLRRDADRAGKTAHSPTTIALLDSDGRAEAVERADTLPEAAARVSELAGGEPFLLGTNIPIVVPPKQIRSRPVEGLVRRRFGFRLRPGGRAALASSGQGLIGEALIAGLAAAGDPCLPFPDRDRRRPGLLETYPGLILKSLLWEASPMSSWTDRDDLPELFRAYSPPPYRADDLSARSDWADQAVALDLLLLHLDGIDAVDMTPAVEQLASASSAEQTEAVAGLVDALLIAGMARRYVEAPELCLFVGDQENGYLVLPADPFIRRLVSETRPTRGRLFPSASLRERLGGVAKLRSTDLVTLPGRAPRLEAQFHTYPEYEFDNLDEMLWWKHTRHLRGPALPTEGLSDLTVTLIESDSTNTLKLVRSRHPTLSFRFDPPASWRSHVPTRDGKTYSFRVVRATYQTLSEA